MLAWAGQINVTEDLIRSGADVNAANKDGMTALHLTVRNDYSLNPDSNCSIAELLIKNNADVNYLNKYGRSALYYATSTGKI